MAGRRPKGGDRGKIVELRGKARGDHGVAAMCLLAALGRAEPENTDQAARQYTGAVLMAEAIADLRLIRLMLTPKKK
jgi:hypothetical protein